MAAIAANVAKIPAWEVARRKRSYKQFISLNCVKDSTIQLSDANASNFDVTKLDVEKMKTLLLNCVAALGIVQQELDRQAQPLIVEEGDQPAVTKETQAALNKVFKASLTTMATAMLHDGSELPKQSNSVDSLLRSFPVDYMQIDGRNWLPLHYAVCAPSVAEDAFKTIYANDPMALQKHHLQGTGNLTGFTPAHLLCMQEMTNRNVSLVRHFSLINQQAFTMSASYTGRGDPLLYSYSALHAACDLGQPTEELLKHLLQLDSSQTKKMYKEKGLNPVGLLCKNSNSDDRSIACLLEVDSSAEVVWRGIVGCLKSSGDSHLLEKVEMLLKANPDAAKHRDSNGSNLLHFCREQRYLSPALCIEVMKRILAIHKDAVREVDSSLWLPIHIAARYASLEVLEFLLGLYKESATMLSTSSTNLLYLAVHASKKTDMEAKVKFLCTRYPAMLLQVTDYGRTPFISAVFTKNIPAMRIFYEIGGQEQLRTPMAHMDADDENNGRLPLHMVINWHADCLRGSLLSPEADCFRMLLRWYPQAAAIEGGVDMVFNNDNDEEEEEEESRIVFKKTPYQLAVDEDLPPYYRRLLLRAAPELDPVELRRMNYEERRMAMFLAFTAVTTQVKPLLMARLRFEKKDLVKHVISFL